MWLSGLSSSASPHLDPPKRAPIGEACPLLGSRQFVMDIARVAEQLVMDDMTSDYFPSAREPKRISCREKAMWPDKCGDLTQPDEVRRRRASWAADIGERYRARVVEWCDTGHELEKQAVVLLLRPHGEAPVAVIAWRGSKKASDYLRTDLSISFVAVSSEELLGVTARGSKSEQLLESEQMPDAKAGLRESQPAAEPTPEKPEARHKEDWGAQLMREDWGAKLMSAFNGQLSALSEMSPRLSRRSSTTPCVTRGLWEAYAGTPTREGRRLGPRFAVRAALERLLAEEPNCRICVSGHSLGGALATLCAYDLLTTSAAVQARGVTMISFASPRFFNAAFQQAATTLQDAGLLRPLRVLVSGDVITRLPPRQMGAVQGVQPRLALSPPSKKSRRFSLLQEARPGSRAEEQEGRSMAFRDGDGDDDDLWTATTGIDPHAHTSHALFLGGESTPSRPQTVPLDEPWPLVRGSGADSDGGVRARSRTC